MVTRGRVERLWPGSTVVCIASGPSLTQADVDCVRGKARVIAVNTSVELAPWADALYACDARWWAWKKGMTGFAGLKFALQSNAGRWPGVTVLRAGHGQGLSDNPKILMTGRNSGYQAVNLAVLLGAARILLLGYDMQRGPKGQEHWHAQHPVKVENPYYAWVASFSTMVEPLKALGIEVVNCSRRTALTCFPRQAIEDALSVPVEAVA